MEAQNFDVSAQIIADIIAQDKKGHPALIVKVGQGRIAGQIFFADRVVEGFLSQISQYIQASKTFIPFVMFVGRESIQIYKLSRGNQSRKVLSLNTVEILSNYDSQILNKTIFHDYLRTLIEAWLRDLAYNWKFENPPASSQIAEIELLQLLRGGTTQAEVELVW